MSLVDTETPTEPLAWMLAAIQASQSKAQYTCKRYVKKRRKEGKKEKGERKEKEGAREKKRERERREKEGATEMRKRESREREGERALSVWFCAWNELETR